MMIDVFEVAFFRAVLGLLAVAPWLGALVICAGLSPRAEASPGSPGFGCKSAFEVKRNRDFGFGRVAAGSD
jgi:hypothetical protein